VDAKTNKATKVYTSGELDTYDYDTCHQNGGWGNSNIQGDGCYSKPVKVDTPVSTKSTEFYVLFVFTNNDRNMHLNEDGMNMQYGLSCPNTFGAGCRDFVVDCAAQRSYAESVAWCKSQGMAIASIHNQQDNDKIRKLLKCRAYLGAESDGRGKWKWHDGTSWDFLPAAHDGLAGKTETKAVFNTDGRWHDWAKGASRFGVVCQKIKNADGRCPSGKPSTQPLVQLIVKNSGQFDGNNDWVEMPRIGTYKQMTIDTWIKFRSVRGNHPIINEDSWSGGSLHYQIYSSQFGFDVNGVGDKTFKWQPKANIWYFISVSYDANAGQIKLSVNNKFVETIRTRKGRSIVMNKARIGAWRSNGVRSLHGAIYSLKIWSKITDGKDGCFKPFTSGLLASYYFDSADTIGKDLSGHNRHGKHNTVTWSKSPDVPQSPTPAQCKVKAPSRCRDFFSPNNQRYLMKNHPLGKSKSVTFSVIANNDAHVGFFSDKKHESEVYEIVIGGWGNQRSAIRERNQGGNKVFPVTKNILKRGGQKNYMWADAVKGLVRVGKGNVVGKNVWMHWKDPNPHEAKYVGVMTGWGSTGRWHLCTPP